MRRGQIKPRLISKIWRACFANKLPVIPNPMEGVVGAAVRRGTILHRVVKTVMTNEKRTKMR